MCACLTDKTPNKTSNKKKTTGNGASASVISLLFMHLPSGEGFKIIGVGGVIEDGHTEGISAIRGGQIMLKILPIMLCSCAQKTTYYASHYAQKFTYYAQIVLDCNERIYDNDDYNERNNDR